MALLSNEVILWIRIILQRLTTDGSQCVQLRLMRLGFQRYCKVVICNAAVALSRILLYFGCLRCAIII
ncbi:hypothetical protein T05_13753 [Trichinella murrelli]|uniref:Uncharacterized protein n=1 Tax=Trichinella murrelli TaxID=144512 RepID=A0A0V0U017_9BILA|nr:hypothetical protein T05_13753 [Trichinella murrelli]